MDRHRWSEVRGIFEEALRRPPSSRASYVSDACSEDLELAAIVRRMLRADASHQPIFDGEPPALALLNPQPDELVASPPSHVGAYRLVEEVGKGGMGVVYRAERADGAFERAVALKVIRGGADSEEILSRFHAEQRILGNLEHPSVARLYDAGRANDGRPYLVMEFVEGTRVDHYCDRRRLDVRGRIRLFRKICEAVQYAHRNLVIHRDLKPSNVLVRGDGSVKLLDFGIAKLMEEEGASKTRTGFRAFTPEYASPEQIRGEQLTTSSDVYSLGVLLYELLTGLRPFEDWAGAAAWALGTDVGAGPPAPSRIVDRMQEDEVFYPRTTRDGFDPASARSTTTGRLRRTLQGDLDRVLMKALARDPGERYSSAESLAEDLERHLSGLPVSARAPSVPYRLRKFVRRNRTGVAAAAAVVLSLGVGTAVAARQARVAAEERDVALAVSGFLEDLFQAPDPRVLQVHDTTRMIDFLDSSVDRIRTELMDQPRPHARMLLVLGLTYKNMGRNDRAEPLLREAIRANRAVHGDRHADLAEAQRLLGLLLSDQDRFEEAVARLDSALAIQRSLSGERSWEVARIHEALGQAYLSEGRLDDAVFHVDAALSIRREVLDPDDAVISNSLNTLAALKSRQGRDDEAIALLEEAIEASLRSPSTVPEDVGVQRMNLASFYLRTGQPLEALPQARRGHEILGENIRPGIVARSRGRLAQALAAVWGETEDDRLAAEADSLFRSGIDLMRTLPEPADARYLLHAYSRFLRSRGELSEAEGAMRQALNLAETALGSGHGEAHRLRADLAGILVEIDRADEAESLAREAHRALEASLPPGHPDVLMAATNLGRALHALDRPREASPLLQSSLDQARSSLGDAHPITLDLEAALTGTTHGSLRR